MAQNAEGTSSPSYQPGHIIVDYCEPFLKTLIKPYSGIRCNNCFEQKTPIMRCTSCKLAFYCDKACQAQDWKKGHQVECRLFKYRRLRDYCRDNNCFYISSALRFYALKTMKHNLYEKQFRMFNGSSRSNRDLKPKYVPDESLRRAFESEKLVSVKMMKLLRRADQNIDLRDGEFHKMLAIIHANKVCILSNDEWEIIGFGIYVELSIFPHSCKPTAHYLNQGCRLQLRAIAPISSGQLPTICHLKRTCPKAGRQKHLRIVYDIECHCEWCDSDSDSGVDFHRLDALFQKMQELRNRKLEMSEWSEVCTVREETLRILRHMFHEYDRRVTRWFTVTLDIGVETGVDKMVLQMLLDETSEHVRVTYGAEHPFHEMFERSTAHYR